MATGSRKRSGRSSSGSGQRSRRAAYRLWMLGWRDSGNGAQSWSASSTRPWAWLCVRSSLSHQCPSHANETNVKATSQLETVGQNETYLVLISEVYVTLLHTIIFLVGFACITSKRILAPRTLCMWSWHVVHAIRYHTIGSYIACKIALAVPDDLFPLTHTFSAILIL